MPGNATPQFTKNGRLGTVLLTAANVASDGTGTIGTDIFKAFTADEDSGSLVDFIRFLPVAPVAASTTATIARIFLSSVATGVTTPDDTLLFAEVVLPVAAAANATTPVSPVEITIDRRLPEGWTVLITQHAAPAAGTNWRAVVGARDY